VPFFNADFNGKVARFFNLKSLTDNLQELDLVLDRARPNVYKGFRGGFVSLWNGIDEPANWGK
jgi:starvation-inducible outer membrane lipoprotein